MSIIAKYKFDSSIYTDLIPEFNAEFTDYTIADEVDSENSNHIIRTIESDSLPTLMRFGVAESSVSTERSKSLLEIISLDISSCTHLYHYFRRCINLTAVNGLIVHSGIKNLDNTFGHCNSLEFVDTSNWDTSNVTHMNHMFTDCYNLTSLDVSNWDTSKVNDMFGMFYGCNNLTSLDVSNWNTSKVTNMSCMFNYCKSLTSLDVSNFDTSKVIRMDGMFSATDKLISLDISNFSISDTTNIDYILTNTPLLTDIGMLYCDQFTINKIASVLPTDTTQTIWVEDVDIKDLTPVEGVEFKQYAKNTEIMLTSPLLEGDKLVVKDGKLYHWHKMGKVVFDGSEDEEWYLTDDEKSNTATFTLDNSVDKTPFVDSDEKCSNCISNNFKSIFYVANIECFVLTNQMNRLHIAINRSRLVSEDVNGFKQWLQANPTTVVYELASPYYELISEDTLTISLIAESSDITNSSNIPLNMTINNKGLSTVAMSPSTTYTVAFDKDTDSEVVVNLCGNEITTTDNVVEITTPSEIDDELIFYGDGVEVSNVRLLEGSVSGDSIPRESFEGLKNSFEDGYIPENELVDFPTDIYLNGSSYNEGNGDGYNVYYHTVSLKTNKVYTVFCNINEETTCTDGLGLRLVIDVGEKHYDIISGDLTAMKGVFCSTFTLTNTLRETNNLEIWNRDKGVVSISNMTILEGDWTHLTEEDWNNLGKYKVDYKVTGKNKFDKVRFVEFNKDLGWNCDIVTYNNKECVSIRQQIYQKVDILNSLNLNRKKTHTISFKYFFEKSDERAVVALKIKYTDGTALYDSITGTEGSRIITTEEGLEIEEIHIGEWGHSGVVYLYDFQLEEGSTATEYEPYKSYTKTFYLTSPLLEGDTIEDVNGVATHVKRYEKVPEKSILEYINEHPNTSFTPLFKINVGKYEKSDYNVSNKLINVGNATFKLTGYNQFYVTDDNNLWISYNGTQSQFLDFIRECDIVCKLASPIHEPISTESILCDSYVNGHLDVDTNIPIEKTVFRNSWVETKYLIPKTDYILQFEADNNGKIDTYHLGGTNLNNQNVTKGLNTVRIASTNNIINTRVYLDGIGFNASNIQVVATDRNTDFDYFKGLQSSFESELVTDEADENYGKYKVECKIVGKNKLNLPYTEQNKLYADGSSWSNKFSFNVIKDKTYTFSLKSDFENVDSSSLTWALMWSSIFSSKKYNQIYKTTNGKTSYTFTADKTGIVYFIGSLISGGNEFWDFQLEESTVATSYEPYQEYTKTIYLNSPLLKGDTIEVHNGKLCHYHKMGKVVLDGSEGTNNDFDSDTLGWYRYNQESTGTSWSFNIFCLMSIADKKTGYGTSICDKFLNTGNPNPFYEGNDKEFTYTDHPELKTLYFDYGVYRNDDSVLDEWLHWLSQNPVTVIYELAEPYYEEIEPTQEDLIITSVKEGDLHIDTIVPISSKVTYNVNVQLLTDFEQSIVEQVQATQTTDLQSILDEEIDN